MKIKQRKELHQKTMDELKTALKEARGKLFDLKLERAQKKLKNTRSIFETRKNIARIATIVKGKEMTA